MAGNFDLKNYSEVKDRIAEFVGDFPDGSIQTFIRKIDGPEVIVEARVYRFPQDVVNGVYTSGIAREIEGKSPVNKTSHIENCETSAIGRALANMAYGADANRASRSEMVKVARMNRELGEMLDFIKSQFSKLTDEATAKVEGQDVKLKDFIKKNGARLPESYRLAREVVEAMEQALEVQFAPSEGGEE